MRSKTERPVSWKWASLLACALVLGTLQAPLAGCSKSEEGSAAASEAESGRAGLAAGAIAPKEHIPPPEISPGAQTVEAAYPGLASSGLTHAKLADLSDGALVHAGGLRLTEADVEQAIARAPESVRDQLRNNAFFILEQLATDTLLELDAKASLEDVPDDEEAMVRAYLGKVLSGVEVSDEAVADFYEENREMIGEASFEQVEESIRRHLLLERQEQILDGHVQTLGQRLPIAVSASWVGRQAELAKDNPVDRARASGTPTFVNFGAVGCVPCEMMEPIRETIREKHEGKLNVVYVHVDKEQVLASRYGVQSIPVLLFYDAEGSEVSRHTGYLPEEKIEEHLARIGVE